jgi:hypothetical protein
MPPDTPEEMPTPPPLDGELRFDEMTRNGRADDFGHIVHHMPEGVLLPGSADDIIEPAWRRRLTGISEGTVRCRRARQKAARERSEQRAESSP